jgi:uncharacterized protein
VSWQLSLAGLAVGLLVGMTGMGGGSLMTPLLVLVFGFNPTVAIGTDVLHGALFKTVGAVRHRQLGTVHLSLSGWMFLASAPMSLVGVALATWIGHRYGDGSQPVLKIVLGVALFAGGLGLLAKSRGRHTERPGASLDLQKQHRWAAVAIGGFGGLIVGLTSIGTGVFFGLTMLILFPLRTATVVGTDVAHAAALLWVAGLGHWVAGNVDLGAVGWLLLGSVPGVLVGSHFTLRVPDRTLRMALATVLILSGTQLVAPGEDWLVVGALVTGAAALGFRPLVARLAPLQLRHGRPTMTGHRR